jgi:hypothetical protein
MKCTAGRSGVVPACLVLPVEAVYCLVLADARRDSTRSRRADPSRGNGSGLYCRQRFGGRRSSLADSSSLRTNSGLPGIHYQRTEAPDTFTRWPISRTLELPPDALCPGSGPPIGA